MPRVDLHPVGEHLQDDGRAREGDDEPDEQTFRNGESEEDQDQKGEQDRGGDLRPPRPENFLAHPPQLRQGNLQPHGEQEEHHADLRQGLDHPDLRDQPRPRGAQNRPGREKGRHHGKAEPAEHKGDDGGDREHHNQVAENGGKFQGTLEQRGIKRL